jgi:hypothetical protein
MTQWIETDGNPIPETFLDWKDGRWWRAVGPDGKLWAESSSESEVRNLMRPGDKLYRDRRVELAEWVEQETVKT